MNKITTFQIILMAIFGVIAVLSVLIFGGILPGYKSKNNQKGPAVQLSLWGTLPQRSMNNIISEMNQNDGDLYRINYFEKSPSSYEEEIVNALASGKGPDFWIVSQDIALKSKDKLYLIPFAAYPERNFLDDFAGASELLIDEKSESFLGLPFLIDPVVLFWNKNLFSSEGISRSPRDWDEFTEAAQSLTRKNENGNIIQSGAALGEFSNINNAKDILSMMIMQAGDPIVTRDSYGKLKAVLNEKTATANDPAISSAKFFSGFSNPVRNAYSWNKALALAINAFAKESLAMYFGYASEAEIIKDKNPHLNFDIAETPQLKESKNRLTFGRLYFLAIMKNAPAAKKQAAFGAMVAMTTQPFAKAFAESVGMSSARRDVMAEKSPGAYFGLVNKSAVMSRAWLEPDVKETRAIFNEMIESMTSGSLSASDATGRAKNKLEQSLRRVID